MDIKAGDPRPLQARLSLHSGSQVVFRNKFGIGLSDTVIVRDSGPETLTSLDETLRQL
jgi:Xaa-Pro aminopeptidase